MKCTAELEQAAVVNGDKGTVAMGTLREDYERRKAAAAKVKPAPTFTLKDYVSIGLSMLALGTTLLFNVFLKTDDIRGAYRGGVPRFVIEDGGLYVEINANLAVTNIGNRTATIVGVHLMVSPQESKAVPQTPCYGGFYYYTHLDLNPVVLKAGEAAVIPIKMPERSPVLFEKIEGPKAQILVCLGVTVFTPSALFDSRAVALATIEVGADYDWRNFRRIDEDTTPFIIYRHQSISW